MVYQAQLDPTERKPAAYHAYLTDSSGAALPIWRLTEERCVHCPPRQDPATGQIKYAVLGVTFETNDGRAETVQCLSCDYSMTRPRKDPPGRRMNQGAGGGG